MGQSSLPISLTSFVGREQELAELSQIIVHTKLITLTGVGGCGKTRLALRLANPQAAGRPPDRSGDGIFPFHPGGDGLPLRPDVAGSLPGQPDDPAGAGSAHGAGRGVDHFGLGLAGFRKAERPAGQLRRSAGVDLWRTGCAQDLGSNCAGFAAGVVDCADLAGSPDRAAREAALNPAGL